MEESAEACEQIAFADLIVLNKTDLVAAEDLDPIEQQIRRLNKVASICRARNSELDLGLVLGLQSADLESKIDTAVADHDDHHHDGSSSSKRTHHVSLQLCEYRGMAGRAIGACSQLGVREPGIRQDLDRNVAGERSSRTRHALPSVSRTVRMRPGGESHARPDRL